VEKTAIILVCSFVVLVRDVHGVAVAADFFRNHRGAGDVFKMLSRQRRQDF
jgi:hypothetical protein